MGISTSTQVLFLKGGFALSEFRIKKLLQDLAPLGVARIEAHHRYFAELTDGLNEDDLSFLFELLHADEHRPASAAILR